MLTRSTPYFRSTPGADVGTQSGEKEYYLAVLQVEIPGAEYIEAAPVSTNVQACVRGQRDD